LFLQKRRWARAIALFIATSMVVMAATWRYRRELLAAGTLYHSTSDRFGVGVNRSYGGAEDFDVGRLSAGWYVDWSTRLAPPHPAGLDYMQIVRTSGDTYTPDKVTLAAIAAANPGAVWIIGNEPDCIWQGNSTPDQYARVYHELYSFLKAHDPTCRVTIGGIVQTTPLRLQWLDAVMTAYQDRYGTPFPVDLWNIHAFILREERGSWGCGIPPGISASYGELWNIEDHDRRDLFAQQIVRFRQWMKDHGERDKELIVSEYGILMPDSYGFDAPRVQAFMRYTFDYFMTAVDAELGCPADGNRLVQRWAWYSLNDRRFEGHTSWSHLFDPTSREITSLGLDFEDYVVPLYTSYVDLALGTLRFSPADPLALYNQPTTITLTAVVRNGGNTDVDDVPVQFWAGSPVQPIGDAQIIATLPARSLTSVSVEWADAPVGTYAAGVVVDAEDLFAEPDEDNNQLFCDLQMDLASLEIAFSPPQPLAPNGRPITVTLVLGTKLPRGVHCPLRLPEP